MLKTEGCIKNPFNYPQVFDNPVDNERIYVRKALNQRNLPVEIYKRAGEV